MVQNAKFCQKINHLTSILESCLSWDLMCSLMAAGFLAISMA